MIRSAYVQNGIASVQAGAGVVFDSVAQAETEETRSKAQAVLSAILAAHTAELLNDSVATQSTGGAQ